ncbi:hypothetical protein R3P38DRAFT_3351145 [Favolaschia claudopus]|uniref:F-box domain-containing protein n=1 Tax=Favolaschia claudopus TaxID=2862362 RepID=A0AAW0CCN7_9AGAR
MHHCLAVPELVDLIISAGLNAFEDRNDLAALAITSTTFHESALNLLWQEQSSVVNLVKCMPPDLWEFSLVDDIETLIFLREIVPEDWDRVFKYSRRVKSLSLFISDDPDMTAFYEGLRKGIPGGYLMPNLQHLLWEENMAAECPFINLFLGPQVTSIELNVEARDNDHCSLLDKLAILQPELRSVVITSINGKSGQAEQSSLWSFIRALPRLKALDVPILDSATLIHLGRITDFKSLTVDILAAQPGCLPGIADQPMFLDLQIISLNMESTAMFNNTTRRGMQITTLLTLFRMFNNSPLRRVVAKPIVEYNWDLPKELVEVIGENSQIKDLNSLILDFVEAGPEDVVACPKEFFRPLFNFPNITSLEIRVPSGYDIDDAMIAEMSRTWRSLRNFNLASSSMFESSCTPNSLYHLAQCRDLLTIRLTFWASGVSYPPPSLIFPPSDHSPTSPLRYLDVEWSQTTDSDVEVIASFISSLFPSLLQIEANRTEAMRDWNLKNWGDIDARVQELQNLQAELHE